MGLIDDIKEVYSAPLTPELKRRYTPNKDPPSVEASSEASLSQLR